MLALQAGYTLFSCNSASVYAVIPAMDKLDSHMNNVEMKEEFQPAIRAAIKLARKKMDRYWNLTDDSNMYHIATGKHNFHELFQYGMVCADPQHATSSPPWSEAQIFPTTKNGKTNGLKLPKILSKKST